MREIQLAQRLGIQTGDQTEMRTRSVGTDDETAIVASQEPMCEGRQTGQQTLVESI